MLRLVGDDQRPPMPGQPRGVPPQGPVRRQHESVRRRRRATGRRRGTAYRRAGCEAVDLALPVAEQATPGRPRASARGVGGVAVQVQAIKVIVLPRPMSSARQPPRPSSRHPGQPAQAAQLVVAQGRLQAGGRHRSAPRRSGSAILARSSSSQRVRRHGDLPAVDLGGASQRSAERVDRGDWLEDPLPRLASQLGIDQHPLVPQPDHRASRLRQLVQLRLGQRVVAEGNLPAEVQGAGSAEEARHVDGGPSVEVIAARAVSSRPRLRGQCNSTPAAANR